MSVYNITDYGAVPDGVTVCTEPIQRAIDLCDNGGTVYVPKGTFITGALYLKSNMTLFLERGAKLLGSSDISDFPLRGYPFEGYDQLCYASLINTDGAPYTNITIDGHGTLDANGVCLFHKELTEKKGRRGRAVCIRNTENVTIRNITIRQSPSWGLHTIFCRNVLIDNIEVHTKYDEDGNPYAGVFNCDGIDIDSCRNVTILNSLIASQDDCIAIKSGRDVVGRRVNIPSENVTIENCIFKSGFGVAMGSEMSGGVRNVYVRNCKFTNTFSIASVKVKRGRGSYIRNIHYENCTLENNDISIKPSEWFRGALYVDGFYGMKEFDAETPAPVDETTPIIEDIYFRHITLKTITGHAVYMCGLPENHFKNIYLENVTAHGEYGIEVKNIDNLQLTDVNITSDKE